MIRQDITKEEVQRLRELKEMYDEQEERRGLAAFEMGEALKEMTEIMAAVKPGDRLQVKEGMGGRGTPKVVEVGRLYGRIGFNDKFELSLIVKPVLKSGDMGRDREFFSWDWRKYEPVPQEVSG